MAQCEKINSGGRRRTGQPGGNTGIRHNGRALGAGFLRMDRDEPQSGSSGKANRSRGGGRSVADESDRQAATSEPMQWRRAVD